MANLPRQLWILAGGNGAGKSTFYNQFLAPRGLIFVNADIIARRLDQNNEESISYKAAILARKMCADLVRSGNSFCFETVFSHPSKIDFVAHAKSNGYDIIFIYIHLENNQLNQARVTQRVLQGGHNVPPEKIISRIPKTIHNVSLVLPLVDMAQLYDNSRYDIPFKLVALLHTGKLQQTISPSPDWALTILGDYVTNEL